MRHVADDERRARLATRHALTPASRLNGVAEITRALTVLHATLPATVYLSCWARADSVEIDDIDRALYSERSLVKQLAMRRTLFVFPRDLLDAAWASASARVARAEGTRMVKDVVEAGLAADGEKWLNDARAEVLSKLSGHPGGLTALELRKELPTIAAKVTPSAGEPWSASRVLTYLGARGDILRGDNAGAWRVSRPRWTTTHHWLGDIAERQSAADGYRELVRRWLWSFGPGTDEDISWWLGSTKTAVRNALAELAAVEVSLDGGRRGWLSPEDLDKEDEPGSWVALLPALDATVMGWRDRNFFVGPHSVELFDAAGNAGTTAWVDGRIVGCWVQDEAGAVQISLLEEVSNCALRALRSEAARLTDWLGGVQVTPPVSSPAMRSALSA